jgi:hypothetical protein
MLREADGYTLRILAAAPPFRDWQQVRLSAPVRRWIGRADHQQLMTCIAAALQRLNRESADEAG